MVIIYLLVFLCKLCFSVASVLSCLCCSSPLFLNLWFKSAGCSLCTFILLLGWDLCLSLHSSALLDIAGYCLLGRSLPLTSKRIFDDFKGRVKISKGAFSQVPYNTLYFSILFLFDVQTCSFSLRNTCLILCILQF